jgi:hypothetical protein
MAKSSTSNRPQQSQNTNGTAGQNVSFGEYNGNRMFNVQNLPFDRFPTQLGTRKVRDVIGNISKALEFLALSDDQRDKEALAKFHKAFKPTGK